MRFRYMLSQYKFTELFNRKSLEIIGVIPDLNEVQESYEGYISVSELVGDEPEIEFKKTEHGELEVNYKFQSDIK